MANNDFQILPVFSQYFRRPPGHEVMACSMETVTAHSVLFIVFIGQGVHERFGRHGLMESCVEYSHLRHFGHKGGDCFYACHICGIVQGGEVVALLDHVLDFIGDKDTLAEFFCSVHHAVAYGIDLGIALDASFHRIGEKVENGLD